MNIKLFILLIFLTSCSTMKNSIISGAVVGGVVGAGGGALYSPNRDSQNQNAYLFGIVGSLIGAGISYYFFKEDRPAKPTQLMTEDSNSNLKELPLFDFSPELKNLKPEVNFKPVKKYEVPLEALPPELVGKAKKQYIIEYESPEKTIEIDNRTIEVGPFKAWEHVYEK